MLSARSDARIIIGTMFEMMISARYAPTISPTVNKRAAARIPRITATQPVVLQSHALSSLQLYIRSFPLSRHAGAIYYM